MKSSWFKSCVVSCAIAGVSLSLSSCGGAPSGGGGGGGGGNQADNEGNGDETGGDGGASQECTNNQKYAFWLRPSFFRGANMGLHGPDDPTANAGNRAMTREDVFALESAGANLVQFSVPGTRDVQKNADGEYAENGILDEISSIVSFAEQTWDDGDGLYYTIGVRSGPGRYEVHLENKWDADRNECRVSTLWEDGSAQDAYGNMIGEIVEAFDSRPHFVGIAPLVEPTPLTGPSPDSGEGVAEADCRERRGYTDAPTLDSLLSSNGIDLPAIYNGWIDGDIRPANAEIPVLIQAPSWSSPWYFTENLIGSVVDCYVVYEVHNYEPSEFSQGGAVPLSTSSSAALEDLLESTVCEIPDAACDSEDLEDGQSRPVFVGEFGRKFVSDDGTPTGYPVDDTVRYFSEQVRQYEEFGWHFAYWTFRGWQFDVESADPRVWDYVRESWNDTPATDSDNDGVPDAQDNCPQDSNKTEPGVCGCGMAETPGCGAPTPTGETITLALGGGVTMDLVRIPAGTFMMGTDSTAYSRLESSRPVHSVTISQEFYIGKYEVTQAQWQAVMGTSPSRFGGCDNCPVEQVSWDDAVEFNTALSNSTGFGIRLPTEAEWEYAARAGTTTDYSFGDSVDSLGDYAWYKSNSGSQTHDVGGKLPNGFGLYDMHGNVWEWCNDWYDSAYYGVSPSTDPTGPASGTGRVLRGGSWLIVDSYLRSANRGWGWPDNRGSNLGFRVAAGT